MLLQLEPHGAILTVFVLVWMALSMHFGVKLKWTDGTIVLPVVLVAVFTMLAAFSRKRFSFTKRVRRVLVDWLPFVGANFVYENLRQFTGVLRARPIDAALDHADRWLFRGTSPTLWMRHVQTPLLTDWLAFTYNLYFILPLGLIVLSYVHGRRRAFVEIASALVMVFYTGFILYVIFPAGPPRFYAPFQAAFAHQPLDGLFGILGMTQGRWDAMNPVKVYASFPSLHCALATVTLCYALRFDGVLARRGVIVAIVAPLVASLWIATVYLRHHWVVDVFAGQALGLACYAASRAIRRTFDRWKRELDSRQSPERLSLRTNFQRARSEP